MTVIKIRIDFDDDRYIGHGRIQLLELIGQHGSIAKAAKAMDMSYKRAWYLMDAFNSMFADPLIERQHGGKGGGAAKLTPFGAELVRQYREMEARALTVFAKPLSAMEKHLAEVEKPAAKPPKKGSQPART
ncbi:MULTISPECIES: winged helix-turn-helix domain-containing protein [unclassified Hyphomicrobium]|jgi:molybdate transport system regulatory protein|uniref:winged helix-turn-helix domain-containing protein n=1 Tax=unclassified Hyphomicrobium TaxID=2619925 RepID=UPI000213DD8E|nr:MULTISPECIES: LysR family transcriptional regulator [unclassified Hyphomicrobium]CCB67009.1 putative transcriptional regulator, ModE family [Hyphomicrobium sp. MC1]